MGQQVRGDTDVIVDHLTLCKSAPGEHHLIQVRHFDSSSFDSKRFFFGCHHLECNSLLFGNKGPSNRNALSNGQTRTGLKRGGSDIHLRSGGKVMAKIEWRKDVDAALKEAKQAARPLLLD